jgi:hypothetical protein
MMPPAQRFALGGAPSLWSGVAQSFSGLVEMASAREDHRAAEGAGHIPNLLLKRRIFIQRGMGCRVAAM